MNMRRQHGYTLIEVLAAFALLAVSMTVLLAALSNSARQVQRADEAGRAALLARSILDEQTTAQALSEGRSEGRSDDGRSHWQLEVSRWQDPDPLMQQQRLADPGMPPILHLRLQLQWGDDPRQRLQLESLRLAGAPAAGDGSGATP